MNIIPTLFAVTKEELFEEYENTSPHFPYFHIDIMQEEFVGIDFCDFEIFEQLEKDSKHCEVHLMVKDYEFYISKLVIFNSVDSIIIHYESFDSKEELTKYVTHFNNTFPKIRLSLALNTQTIVEEVFDILSLFSQVMVMGVKAGAQGQKLINEQIYKARILQKLGCEVSIDGGINNESISKVANYHFNQVNVGSFLNKAKDVEENYKQLLSQIFPKEFPIIIADVGGTYTKIFRGFSEHFSTEQIEIIETSKFKSAEDLMREIISSFSPKKIILGIAGKKKEYTISMTHENLHFNKNDLYQKFGIDIELYNDVELAGYGISQNLNLISNQQKNASNYYLEILIIMGTGLGMCHISNEKVVFSSEGGHAYARNVDESFFYFLKSELNKDAIEFDDILSSSGLERRYYYDTNEYLSSIEIIKLAKEKNSKVEKTMNFFMQEVLFFLKDCIMFDNIVSTLYLGGEFLADIIDLFQIYQSNNYKKEILSQVHVEVINTKNLPFLGALKLIHQEKN